MSNCPYTKVDSSKHWKKSVKNSVNLDMQISKEASFGGLSVIGDFKKISSREKIGSAGSCFAAEITKHLVNKGFNYVFEEKPKIPMTSDQMTLFGFGQYSARYGNIYTASQLLQLIQRALGERDKNEGIECFGDRYFDIVRPFINGGNQGFANEGDCINARHFHLKAIRRLIKSLDVFVFTLGLTEAWVADAGLTLPVCPGCGYGSYDDRFQFKNFSVEEIKTDLMQFIKLWNSINPRTRFVFTVSPVPLAASFSEHDVWMATSISKSRLLISATELALEYDNVCYFPSYEIVTAPFRNHSPFKEDMRSVRDEVIAQVMGHLDKSLMSKPSAIDSKKASVRGREYASDSELIDNLCDEERAYL